MTNDNDLRERIKQTLQEQKNSVDEQKLERDVEAFRNDLEKSHQWEEDKQCFKGHCHWIAEKLEAYLRQLGYEAVRVRGYYSNASEQFHPNTEDWDTEDVLKYYRSKERNGGFVEGLKFPHWWVEVNRKYIVDVTEDQFHLGEEDDYRIGVYRKPVAHYRKG